MFKKWAIGCPVLSSGRGALVRPLAGCLSVDTHVEEAAITLVSNIAAQSLVAATPRAQGRVRLVTKQGRAGRSVLRDLHQAGSAKIVFPRVQGGSLQAVTVNTAGGITGGDRFEYSFEAGTATHLSVTTQAAERAYGAQPDQTGRMSTALTIGHGARLDWVPQETILFDNSRFERSMRIDMAGDASLLFVEPLVFGRAAMGEVCAAIAFRDQVEVWRDGSLVFCDAMTLTGDVGAQIGAGIGALASVVFIAPSAAGHLNAVRALLPNTAGASLIRPDILHIRCVASDSFVLRQTLVPVLHRLGDMTLPRAWMI